MTEFERDVLDRLANIGERLARLETQMIVLPCLVACPAGQKNSDGWRRWAFVGLGMGMGLTGAGGALVKVLGF